jgi:hypothetical protein
MTSPLRANEDLKLSNIKTYTVGTAVTLGLAVKLSADDTVTDCGANDLPVGIALETGVTGARVQVAMLGSGGQQRVKVGTGGATRNKFATCAADGLTDITIGGGTTVKYVVGQFLQTGVAGDFVAIQPALFAGVTALPNKESTTMTNQMSYRDFAANLHAIARSTDPKHVEMVRRANEGLLRTKLLGPGAVHHDSTLSSLSIQYKNEEFIGTQLMPIANVGKMSDYYYIYDKRNRLAYPDDAIGARGEANEIYESRSDDTYSCKSYGYKNFVDALTLANQDAPLDEMIDLVESVNEGVDFREEKRIATVLTTSGNFGSNTTAISAGSRWNTTDGGNPIKDIQDAMAAVWMGRGPTVLKAYCSLDVWNVLSRHPAVLDLFKFNGSSPGLATPKMLAGFLGLDEVLVGKARKDTANDGASASYGRLWSNVFGIVRVAQRPSIRIGAFGFTMRFGQKQTDQWFDISKGTQGGYFARVTVNEDHKVTASDTGFLITTPIN